MSGLFHLHPKPITEPHQKQAVQLLQTDMRWSDGDVVFLRNVVCSPVLSVGEQAKLGGLVHSLTMEAVHG